MLKRNFRYSTVIIGLLVSCFLLVGCNFSFFDFTVKTLDTPVIGLDRENKSLNWHTIDKADKYNVFINDGIVGTVENMPNETMQVYNFTDNLVDFGYYRFKVQAISNKPSVKSSVTSISITYVYTNSDINEIASGYNIIYEDEIKAPDNIVLNTETVTWSAIPGATNYVVVAYTMLNGVTTHQTTEVLFDIASLSNDEIVVFSVGAYFEVENALYVDSPTRYFYNPESQGNYTNQVYIFDGYVGDHYIQSMEELNNIAYYNFINRLEVYDVRFAEAFLQDIGVATLSNESIQENILEKIDSCFEIQSRTGPFFETCQSNSVSGYNVFGKKMTGQYDYQIAINFFGVEECDINIDYLALSNLPYEQNAVEFPYYENFANEGGRRLPTYDEFVSDDYFITQEVATSEQLYWAVENRVSPLVVAGSRAESIYNIAKNVLREIIHPSMSEYEKALSIFDWITVHTAYDNADIEKIYTDTKDLANPIYITLSPAYYLEGVFIKGVAVCDGFSKAYSLLCNMEGIECIRITGMAGGAHAWNKVKVDGNFYLVDITWTEIKAQITNPGDGPNGKEYLTHKYFLLADRASLIHKAYIYRPKFSHYATALDNYNHYAKRIVSYKNEYGVTITEDFVIESDSELYNLMRYFLINKDASANVIFTKKYVTELFINDGGGILYSETIKSTLLKVIKNQKYPIQMLDTVCSYGEGFYQFDTSGNEDEHYGIIFYMSFDSLIDEAGELANLISYMKAIELITPGILEGYSSKLYINVQMLEGVAGSGVQQKINNYVTSLNLADDIVIEFSNEILLKKFYGSDIAEELYICNLTINS